MAEQRNKSWLDDPRILIAGVVVLALLFIGGMFLAGGDDEVGEDEDDVADVVEPDDEILLDEPAVEIGYVVSATAIDRDGCAVGTSDDFGITDTIYVVAEDSTMPNGSNVFVRLYRNNEPLEDTREISADRDYDNVCINFAFEPEAGETFLPGDYEAEVFVNGNPMDSISFDIQ